MLKTNFEKLISVLAILFFTSILYSQNIQKNRDYKSTSDVNSIDLIKSSKKNFKTNSHVSYSESYELFQNSIDIIISNPQTNISIPVTFKNQPYLLELEPNFLKTSTYTKTESKKRAEQNTEAYFFKGKIDGQNGWCTLAIINREIKIIIAHESGNIEINNVDGGYIGYEQHDRYQPMHYQCDITDDGKKNITQSNSDERQIADCLELYIECDYQSFLDNNSSSSQTEAWALSLINDVSAIYDMIDIPLVVSASFIHTTPDPYVNISNKSNIRNEFINQVEGNYNGRIAYLFSTRDLDGGIAYGIGGFCAVYPDFPGPYALAGSLSSTVTALPAYSFNTQVIAHELGHVMGSRHTHACVWNSDDTQIDDCGNLWATNNSLTPEGATCYDTESPIIPNEGSIMSLCELVSGTGVNLSNGFNSQPGDLIKSNYLNAICSTGGLCASIPPSNDFCAAAIPISPKPYCVPERFDNFMATSTGIIPSCASSILDDVWFTFTSTGSNVVVEFEGLNTLTTPIIAIYTGNCASLTEISCTANTSNLSIPVNNIANGVEIYIQIIERSNNKDEFNLCIVDPSANCHPFDAALVDLYNSTNGSSWSNNQGWASTIDGSNCDICKWYGIVCDQNQNIIEIGLSSNNLIGTVPQSLEVITTLKKLDLFSNQLSGDMPNLWVDMVDLEYLDLSSNSFTGLIPRSVIGLTNLKTLYLENNNLIDTLPYELGLLPNIDVLWLKNNNLSGCWPTSFTNICNISSKTFSGNINLPRDGDFNLFCSSGIGEDNDMDGFCRGDQTGEDCDDGNQTIYPNAPELCDGRDNNCNGIIDENIISVSFWTGQNIGQWSNGSNWSTGIAPRACEDVLIEDATVFINSGFDAFARSLTLGNGSSLTNDGELFISGSDDIGMKMEVNSNCTNNTNIDIDFITSNGLDILGNMVNNGTISIRTLENDPELILSQNGSFNNIGGNVILQD